MYIVVAYVGGVETAATVTNNVNSGIALMKNRFNHYGSLLKIKTQSI